MHSVVGDGRLHRTLTWPTGHLCALPRCLHGIHQGLSMCYQEVPSECDLSYADFLSLDISMLRLFESFLEATPQLTLVLAIVLQSGQAEYYQCECWSFCSLLALLSSAGVLTLRTRGKIGRLSIRRLFGLDSNRKSLSSCMSLEQ